MRMVANTTARRPRTLRRLGGVLGMLTIAAALVLGGAGIAHSQTDAVTIFACVDKTTGALRLPPPTAPKVCGSNETSITWNQEGPQGATGATGVQGDTGAQGPQGLPGPKGDTGAQGPKGNTGATGAQGQAGPQGLPGVSGMQVVTANGPSSNANLQVVTATCPAGKKAISGGAFPIFDTGVSGIVDRVAIRVTRPLTVFSSNDSWNVHAFETSQDNFTTWHLQVYAVCVTVTA